MEVGFAEPLLVREGVLARGRLRRHRSHNEIAGVAFASTGNFDDVPRKKSRQSGGSTQFSTESGFCESSKANTRLAPFHQLLFVFASVSTFTRDPGVGA